MSGIFRRPLNQAWFVKFKIVDVRPDRVSDHPTGQIPSEFKPLATGAK
jgi:hypothetical protein